MIYYCLIIILSLFSFLRYTNIKRSYITVFVFISFIFLITLGGLRFEVGADWVPYEILFNNMSSWYDVFNAREEKLYMIISYILKLLYNNYSFYIFIFFTISFSIKYYIIQKYSPDIFLSLIVYLFGTFLIYDVNGIRQGMAMAFVMLSIPSILNRKIIPFIILILTATFFHISALIFFPVYFLSRINISNKAMGLFLVGCIGIAIPIRYFLENSAIIQLIFATETFRHYSIYSNSAVYAVNTPILSIALFQRLFIFLLFIFTYKDININSKVKLLFRNGYFISIIIFLFLSFNGQFAARLSFYYKNLDILFIPLIVNSFPKVYQRVFMLVLFVLFCLVGVYRLINIPMGYLIPYDNFLNHIL